MCFFDIFLCPNPFFTLFFAFFDIIFIVFTPKKLQKSVNDFTLG